MKAFAVGVIVGAGVCFAVVRIASPPPTEQTECEPAVSQAAPRAQAQPEPTSSNRIVASNSPERSAPPPAASAPVVSRAPASPAVELTAPVTAAKKCFSIEDITEKDADQFCLRAHQLRSQRERAEKDAEPKDPGWAYSMESLIRQHMEANVPRDQYTKLQIDCRTTFCELRMEGTVPAGQDLADRIAKEIVKQPWSDIASKGAGGGSSGDEWHISYEWFRPRTDEERRLWLNARPQD